MTYYDVSIMIAMPFDGINRGVMQRLFRSPAKMAPNDGRKFCVMNIESVCVFSREYVSLMFRMLYI